MSTKEVETPVITPVITPTQDPSKIKIAKPKVMPKPQA
jgi:hypothetical protein